MLQAAKPFKFWITMLICTAVAIPFSLVLLDAPVASFFVRGMNLSLLKDYAPSSLLLCAGLFVGAVCVTLYGLAAKQFPPSAEAILLAAAASSVSDLAAEFLKPMFSRPPTYFFVWRLKSNFGWHSQILFPGTFPSTHAALATAGLTVLSLYYPRTRNLSLAALAAIDALMVMGSWHFISDVLAGNMLGLSMALLICGTMTALKTGWKTQ